MNSKKLIHYLFAAAVILGISCGKDLTVSGTEIRNGNCMGKIYDSDGIAADNALVRLIPSDYNPYAQTNKSIDSTYTNPHGDYAFTVSQPNYYNIVAEKGSTSCLQDSIFVQADAKTVVNNDTLRESGTLAGAVRLKPGDDSRTAVILVLGANVYTVPSDTSGRFSTPLLPKGNYTIQIFTTLSGYAVLDTNVTIREGAQTQLDVFLPSANAPSIAKLSASYDSATMFVSLSWTMPDTSKIVSYALCRKSGFGNDTMWVLDKSAISYIDDIVELDGDSVSYEIAGIGKNYREGYRARTQVIVARGRVYCLKTIDLRPLSAGLNPIGGGTVFSGRENELFLVGGNGIYKLDSNGVVRKDYILDNPGPSTVNWLYGYLQSDDFGHLYIHKYDRYHPAVIKFDMDLNVLAEIPLDTGFEHPVSGSIEVTGNGTIYTFAVTTESPQGYYTDVKAYDSASAVLKDFRVMNRKIFGAQRFGDTMVTYEYHGQRTSDDRRSFIHFYDTAFSLRSVFDPCEVSLNHWTNIRFSNITDYTECIAAPNGMFIFILRATDMTKDSSLLLITDRNGQFLARISVPVSRDFSFDARGNLCFVTYQYSEWEDVSDNPMKTMFIYTLAPLFGAKTR